MSYPTYVHSIPGLRGYWRLGEGASPFADTSGYAGGPRDAVRIAEVIPMTLSIAGALTGDDDGAVAFNASSGGHSDVLHANETTVPSAFNFGPGDSEMTAAAWVKPFASASSFVGQVIGTFADAGFGLCGWQLAVTWPARTPEFNRRNEGTPATAAFLTGPALDANAWSLIVGTYKPAVGAKLYVNGILVASNATTFGGLPTFNSGVYMGLASTGGPNWEGFYGGIDEVAVWGHAMTSDEVALLYAATLPTGVYLAPTRLV